MIKSDPLDEHLEQVIIDCVHRVSGVAIGKISWETDVVFGLGMAGDDGVDLINCIRNDTGTQLANYDFLVHFGPEAAFSMHVGKSLTVAQIVHLVRAELD